VLAFGPIFHNSKLELIQNFHLFLIIENQLFTKYVRSLYFLFSTEYLSQPIVFCMS